MFLRKERLNKMTLAQVRAEEVQQPQVPQSEPTRGRKRRKRLDPAASFTLAAMVVFLACMILVGQKAQLAALSYDLHEATQRLAEVQRIQTNLSLEVERAKSLDRIETQARTELGMINPTSSTWVVMERTQPTHAVAPQEPETGLVWIEAVSQWFDRVRQDLRAALPMPLRSTD